MRLINLAPSKVLDLTRTFILRASSPHSGLIRRQPLQVQEELPGSIVPHFDWWQRLLERTEFFDQARSRAPRGQALTVTNLTLRLRSRNPFLSARKTL